MHKLFKKLIIIFITSILLVGCGENSTALGNVLSTDSVENENSESEAKHENTDDDNYGLGSLWGDIKDTYKDAFESTGNDLKESYNEILDAFDYSDIYDDALSSLKESYKELYGDQSSLLGTLSDTKEFVKSVIAAQTKDSVRSVVDSIDDTELKTIVQYALVAKDLMTNYSDYSIENVTPEFKEEMDSLEQSVIEIIELERANNDKEKKSLEQYKDLLDVIANTDTAYTNRDDLSQADREYFDIVMLRVAGMLFVSKTDS